MANAGEIVAQTATATTARRQLNMTIFLVMRARLKEQVYARRVIVGGASDACGADSA
ncbi:MULTISPECIES: hypothetical protein [Xanthomonas]|uniref:Uncharacterized protein n=1 Tax=Xanthomonas dyei TaxID=743699 RepID=A0ABZ0DEN5_9XANT|nr:hypothetical protein [Xanthomonas dyei]MCC4632126.1 hypothetical protein [Xanthomonas dyei pv. eucalypti]WOB28748.1 hypothetical protein NYR99_02615 [Xanthomonas dyei]WOB56378.1 hypothetical protein NYR95_02620 [Xanthomonas dyei]